jgi:hypothetical protein
VPAVVDYVPADRAGCLVPDPGTAPGAWGGPSLHRDGEGETATGPSLSGPGPRPGADVTMSKIIADGDGVKFTIDPGSIKRGEEVYITTSTGAIDSVGMAITMERPVPPCAKLGATP